MIDNRNIKYSNPSWFPGLQQFAPTLYQLISYCWPLFQEAANDDHWQGSA